MQPLKKFTQCSGLTLLFGVFIILFGVSSTALTTFGKSNIPSSTQAPAIKSRECTNHEDCNSLKDTSCVKDPDDYKLRCLCGDDTAPDNGFCKKTAKG
uniref:EGF-like domain-containing protein n=1 Tax=Megaselia scalaris TaxID=36166 RepID=T1GJL2_MEGSC